MQLDCPRCGHTLQFDELAPRFCSHCGQPLSTGLDETIPGGSPTPDPLATSPHPGQHPLDAPHDVGTYRLVRTLGTGGMGTVYEAVETASGRHVALKLIRSEFAGSTEAVERFRREGRLASSITHPRCVFVFAADEQAGRPYIVMELMPGRNLHDLVGERGPLPVREAVSLILDVIEGLQEAHRRGVIHRDVKPSNCFLTEDGRVKVGDFGLAKSLIGPEFLTRSGAFLGTLLFASPEQIRNEPLNAQTDVYSVCATLYFLLTGRAPFQSSDADPAATLARTVSDPLTPMRYHRPDLPRAIDEIAERGLARSRAQRWRSLEELRLALLPFVSVSHSLDEVGWRACAYLFDLLMLIPIEFGLQHGLRLGGIDGLASGPRGHLMLALLISFVCGLGYFGFSEWFVGCTPGKLLMRLRVRESDTHDRPRWWRAVLRTLWFYLFKDLGAFLVGMLLVLPGGWLVRDGEGAVTARLIISVAVIGLLPFVSSALGMLLLAVTMRRRNGYRGLHEWLSGTETIRLPAARVGPGVPDRSVVPSVALPPGMPAHVGAFTVRGVLRAGPDERVLACEDGGLGRPVWVWKRRSGIPLSAARPDLSREARTRWLSGGHQDDWVHDAFVAPPGCLLVDLVSKRRPLGWSDTLPLLDALAEELQAAEQDGTLPPVLNVTEVWLQPSGRPVLLDMPLRDVPPAESALDLMRQTAALALEGRMRAAHETKEPIRAPLPAHADDLLSRLMGATEPFANLGEVRQALAEARDRAAEISRPVRGFQIVLSAMSLLPGLLWLFGLGLLFLSSAYLLCIAAEAACERAMEQSKEQPQDAATRQEQRDLEEVLANVRADRELVLGAWTRYVRQQLTAQEDQFRERFRRGRGSEPDDLDLLGRLGDELIQGPRYLTNYLIGEWWRVLLAFAIWPLAWCLWSGLTRGGLVMRLAGMTLRNRNGRPAARWRCVVRSLIVWLPVLLLLLLSFWVDVWRIHHGPDESMADLLGLAAWLSWWSWWQALLLLPVYVWMGVRWPNRGMHDWLAGTYPVPL